MSISIQSTTTSLVYIIGDIFERLVRIYYEIVKKVILRRKMVRYLEVVFQQPLYYVYVRNERKVLPKAQCIIPAMNKFYTTKGDEGYTGLLGKERVAKYHPRIEAIGAIDEATAALGLARSQTCSPEIASILLSIQKDFYLLMGEIAAGKQNAKRFQSIDANKVAWLEEQIDRIGKQIQMPDDFIVPGNTPAGAAIAMARTIVRRSERLTAVLLHKEEIGNRELYRYLNRVSSLCFVLELFEYSVSGVIATKMGQ